MPKIKYSRITLPFWSDYSYRLVPSDIGLTTFKAVAISVSAVDWATMVDIQDFLENSIRLRAWEISGTTNATVTLKNSGSLIIGVTAVYYT